MGGWFLSTLCTSVAAAGLAGLVTMRSDPEGFREALDRLSSPGLALLSGKGGDDAGRFMTAPIRRGSLEQVVTATGALQPVETVEVGSQVPGLVAKVLVDFNDRVGRGTPLAQIDRRSHVARVDQERAALEVASANARVQQARLERARIDLDNARANRGVLSARLDNAKVMEDAARRNVDRKAVLRSREVASATSVEEAQTELASRSAQVRETTTLLDLNRYAVDAAAADVRRLEAELAEANASVPLRQAALRAAEIELDRTTIRSPIDGVVVGRFVNEGQTLAAGLEARTAFNVARNLAEMEIHARVDETDIGRVAPGQKATFTVDAYQGRRFEATVRQVRKAPQVAQGVVTYTVVMATENRDGALLPGMTALARLTVRHEDDILKVPLAALRFRPAGKAGDAVAPRGARDQAVWVLDGGGGPRQVPVTTGTASADQVVLVAGALAEGDRVVVGEGGADEPRRLLGIRIAP